MMVHHRISPELQPIATHHVVGEHQVEDGAGEAKRGLVAVELPHGFPGADLHDDVGREGADLLRHWRLLLFVVAHLRLSPSTSGFVKPGQPRPSPSIPRTGAVLLCKQRMRVFQFEHSNNNVVTSLLLSMPFACLRLRCVAVARPPARARALQVS